MNNAYRKNVLRTIRSTRSRFIAIAAIMGLGVAMLCGLMSTGPDMKAAGNRYFAAENLCDIRVVSTLGLTEADVKAIAETEGVEAVLPVKSVDAEVITENGDTLAMRAQGLPEGGQDINRLTVTEGRLPTGAGECAVLPLGFIGGIALGDQITLADTEKDDLAQSKLTVVGVVSCPTNFSVDAESTTVGDGTLSFIAYLPENQLTADYYTTCYLTVAGADAADTFTDAYDEILQPVEDRLEEIAPGRAELRRTQVRDDAQQALDDARGEYEDKKTETEEKLADGQAQLDDARETLDASKAQLDKGETAYTAGVNALAAAKSGAKNQIEASRVQLSDAIEQLRLGRQELNNQKAAALGTMLDSLTAYMSGTTEALDKILAGLADQAGNIPPLPTPTPEPVPTPTPEETPAPDATPDPDATAAPEPEATPTPDPDATATPEPVPIETLTPAQPTDQTEQAAQALQQTIEEARESLRTQSSALQTKLDDARGQLAQLYEAEALLDEYQSQLDAGLLALAMAPYQAGNQFEEAESTLEESRKKLDDGWAEYNDGVTQWEEAVDEFATQKADAERQLGEAEEKLNDAQDDIDAIESCSWYVLDRDALPGVVTFEQNADRIAAIARVFPVFFFLVAALVALTTMTRLVDEERGQIGVFKALGYRERAISGKYILYALTASLTGSLIGMVLGFFGFPSVIWFAYSIMYHVPGFRIIFYPGLIAAALAASVLTTVGATAGAVHATLAEKPAALLQAKAPPAGKRILLEYIRPLWRQLGFHGKVTARNLFRYKKRFFMTVLGVAGCTALLLVGFGLQDSIMDVVDTQNNQLWHYDLTISMKDAEVAERYGVNSILQNQSQIADSMRFYQKTVTLSTADGTEKSTTLCVPETTARMPDFVTLRTRLGHKAIGFDGTDVVLTEKQADALGVQPGDVVYLHGEDDARTPFTVSAVTENYLFGRIYIAPEAYQIAVGALPDWNTVLAMSACGEDTAARDALKSSLLAASGVTGASFSEDVAATFTNTISCINYVVLVIILCAAALAATVLYNLININVAERKKELATIKVLGFYEREVAGYIFREIYILGFLGSLAGLALGVPLHRFIILTVEIDQLMFIRQVAFSSYLYSVALTMLFTVLVSLCMLPTIRHINMVESLKAPE